MSQILKSSTAAQKLGILLSAAPEEFQQGSYTREEVDALRADPPAWMQELLRNGPFPRDVVAAKLGVSNSGLARAGMTEPLDADQIGELLANPPAWLIREREVHREVIIQAQREKADKARQAK